MKLKSVSKFVRNYLTLLIPLLLLIPLYAVLYKIYIPRVNAFGCFDDCFNYLGGYFIANGKHIYSDFFFNHQPIPAFLSFAIQTVTSPINIFDLVLRHRQALMLFGLLFNVLLILRFRLPAFLFVIIFELSKFYVFGDRFLAEGIIVYPIVYLVGLALLRLSNHKFLAIDYILSAIFAWFVIFSREPYVPLAFFLFATVLWGKFDEIKKISAAIFITLSILTLLYIFDLREYFFNIVTINYSTVFTSESNTNNLIGPKIFQIFLYPFYILIQGNWNLFRQLLIGIDIIFIALLFSLIKNRKFLVVAFIFLLLGLANLRITPPGSIFYGAFHMIVWYGLFIFITTTLVFWHAKYRLLFIFSSFVILMFLLSFLTSKFYFAYERIDQHAEFLTNYGETMQIGEVVKKLSEANDTLFLDGSDDLIYWQANRLSPYKYSWYTSFMRLFPKYSEARIDMLKTNPPDFYKEFGSCPKKDPIEGYSLPEFIEDDYVRLYNLDKPSCLFVHKKKIEQIKDEQWKKANEFLYHLPTDGRDQP